MTACKHYQRQLALLSVDALDANEKTAALEHLKLCPACTAYWDRLQTIVALYREDADRPIESAREPIIVRARPKLFTWPRAAALAVSAIVLTVGFFLFRENSSPPPATPVVAQPDPGSALSIADSRRLLNKDLDALVETPGQNDRREFVYSVATRYEGP